ncbi:zinc finger, C3HC4 type (RING finger) domain-containing protein [Besnoitia besnoiti]|uniref:RING-type E3 ubiquitin transferase n=1 Tax=Besnoitia besnoiti TaxID=94643 RepID=A0A2A9MQA0_BESBE|nr:zinc finger, C3HC4 type (RING finger) domain-containing protein [Besnoitia besnoiti]PFH38160.1 zinc finger, C3HC4 type (RING finger) domain-containing protein [Besnoitia besnoiti]
MFRSFERRSSRFVMKYRNWYLSMNGCSFRCGGTSILEWARTEADAPAGFERQRGGRAGGLPLWSRRREFRKRHGCRRGGGARVWPLRRTGETRPEPPGREERSSSACMALAASVLLILFLFNLDSILDSFGPSSPRSKAAQQHGGDSASGLNSNPPPTYYPANKREQAPLLVGMDRTRRYSLQFNSEFFFFVFDPFEMKGATPSDLTTMQLGRLSSQLPGSGLSTVFPFSSRSLSLLTSGAATLYLYTTRTIFHSVRMALLRIHLNVSSSFSSSSGRAFPFGLFDAVSGLFVDRDMYLRGVDLRDIPKTNFQGSSLASKLPVAKGLSLPSGSADTTWCTYTASLQLNFEPGLGKSAREVDEASVAELSQRAAQNSDAGASLATGFSGHWRRLYAPGNSAVAESATAASRASPSHPADQRSEAPASSDVVASSAASGRRLPGEPSSEFRSAQKDKPPADVTEPEISLTGEDAAGGESARGGSEIQGDLVGELVSSDCGFYVFFRAWEVDYVALASHITSLTLIFNVKTLVEMRLFWKQMQYTEGIGGIGSASSQALLQRVSILGLAWQAALDVFEVVAVFRVAMHLQLMVAYFCILIMFKSVLFGALEVRYLLMVWNARHQGNPQELDSMGRALTHFYRNFYGSLAFLVLFLYYIFPAFPPICVVLYFVWLPQIAWDVWKGQRNSMDLQFIVGLSICRLVFPAYLFGCPASLFRDAFLGVQLPNYPVLVLIAVILALQVFLMLAQRRFGSRFFVPLDRLPHVYNYHRPLPSSLANDTEGGLPECAICMNTINLKGRCLASFSVSGLKKLRGGSEAVLVESMGVGVCSAEPWGVL